EVFHSCMWLARARARNLLARELATNGREQAAEAAIEEGLKLVADARVDLNGALYQLRLVASSFRLRQGL
ncbi:MAG: hypothetical protein QGH33_09815, partial [Pirellulaceae bacterium]|nr:hypothetical protein [Pirellulaceae bacterium]